jgi:16S rRNA (adenine1518-N6/adenine1519-N6)-dimethyltransferase
MKHQAKKRFGQNFLRDKNLLKKIVESADIEQKNVIEVGPGQGALTGFLALKAKSVVAYEIDFSLQSILQGIEKSHPNLTVIFDDFMKVDLSTLTSQHHVVANVPYYITTPILFKILEEPKISTATMMIQKEVCDRLLAKPKDSAYNALSIIIESMTEAYKVMDVKRHLFFPIPNVDSAVIRLVKREVKLLDDKGIHLVKAAFTQKRKTLTNNWHQAFDIPKTEIEKMLVDNGYNKDIRAEHLSLEDFIKLREVFFRGL